MRDSLLAVYKLEPVLDVPKYGWFESKDTGESCHRRVIAICYPGYDGPNLRPNNLAATWKPVEVLGRVRKLNDYPCLDAQIPTFSQRAVDALRDFLEPNGELLPLTSPLGQYWAYNVTTVADILEDNCPEAGFKSKPLSEDRVYRRILPRKLEGLAIFRMQQDCSSVYVTEPFVQRVRECGLRGLRLYRICPLPSGVTWRDMWRQASWDIEHEDLPKDKTPKGNTLVVMLPLLGSEPSRAETTNVEKMMDELDSILVDPESDAPPVGSLEGDDRIPGQWRLFLSCPDADELAKKLWPWLQSLKWNGEVKVVKRYGEYVDASAREEYVDLKSSEPGKSVEVRETPLSDELREKIATHIERGWALLELAPRTKMATVQEAIEAWIEKYRTQGRPVMKPDEAAWTLGALWGDSLCRYCNWQWAMVNRYDAELCGVVSMARECVVFPIDQIRSLLTDPTKRINTHEVFKLIRKGKFPPTKPKGYLVLGSPEPAMQQIVPG